MKHLYLVLLLSAIITQALTLTRDNANYDKEQSTSSDHQPTGWAISWPSFGVESIKKQLGETIDSAGQMLTKTADTVTQQVKAINIQETITFIKETAQPYAETVINKTKDAVGSIKETGQTYANSIIDRTVEAAVLIKETTQPYAQALTNKTSETAQSIKEIVGNTINQENIKNIFYSIKDGDWSFSDYLPLNVTNGLIEEAIAHIIYMKEYAKSNIDRNDIDMGLDVILLLFPKALIIKKGGKIILDLAQNSEDITELVEKTK